MRRTSRPRCIRSGSGWRRSCARRRAGGSSPTRRTARPGRSSTGPACRPHSSSHGRGRSTCCSSTASTGSQRKVRQLAQLAEELDRLGVVAAFGDGAVRHRRGGGPDDAADAGGVRGVRARDDRRPRHRRHRAAREGGPLGDRQAPVRLPRATTTRTSSRTSGRRRSSAACSSCTRVTGSARPRSRGCSRDECAPAPARGWQPAGRAVALRERGLPRPRPLARRELPRPARAARRRGHLRGRRRRCCASAART